MSQTINTLAQLQRLRDKSVKDSTVKLAQQKQLGVRYENNIKALGYLIQKTGAGGLVNPSVEVLKNVAGYKGSLQRVIEWQEQEKTLAKIKENRLQKNLVKAACEEKIVAMTLEDQREAEAREQDVRDQKTLDEIATQCWLRQRLNRG
ncbi:flagellar export protein FliJ [Dryocola sp. BD626]|jgi:flagellar export protein FliJ|uniref:flagellar export protein FliJ n=1 Tax=Dryocola sp. BD626 TaxID=3133273 RepID=UPI003F4F44D8